MSEQDKSRSGSNSSLSGRDTYNLITDTVAGPNLRLKDNLYQGLAVAVCTLIGAVIGAFALENRTAGVLVGGVSGAVVGLLASGIFLMIYRATKHLQGHHD